MSARTTAPMMASTFTPNDRMMVDGITGPVVVEEALVTGGQVLFTLRTRKNRRIYRTTPRHALLTWVSPL